MKNEVKQVYLKFDVIYHETKAKHHILARTMALLQTQEGSWF